MRLAEAELDDFAAALLEIDGKRIASKARAT
jgi:hypothetical protein